MTTLLDGLCESITPAREAMASAPVDSATPSLVADSPTHGPSSHDLQSADPKREAFPVSTKMSSGAETPVADVLGPTTAAGRKRKLNSTSARGVANLTPEQLAKKRANDRQAQRAIRERTKGHIESLEQKVRELSSQKPFLDLQAALRQNEAIQAENREIKRGLKAIMDIIQPLLGRQEIPDGASSNTLSKPILPPPASSPFPETITYTPNTQRSATAENSYTESIASVDTPSPTNPPPTLAGFRRNSTNSADQTSSLRLALDSQRHNLAHGLDFCSEERLGFNFLLDGSRQVHRGDSIRRTSDPPRSSQVNTTSPLYTSPLTSTFNDQSFSAFTAPTRNIAPTCTLDAILLDFLHNRQQEAAQGVPRQKLVGPPYPSVSSLLNPERSVYSHPVSKVFTDIVRSFPDISALPEQVATLYVMFLLMRWQIYPTQENYDRLPEWLTPRPSQLLTPHPAWIDYLVWPRMRDRLVMSYESYPFDDWFIPFTQGLSVNWPYEASDCLLSTTESDELVINPVFERHLRNLGNWSLGPAFAEAFPALVDTARIELDAAGHVPSDHPQS